MSESKPLTGTGQFEVGRVAEARFVCSQSTFLWVLPGWFFLWVPGFGLTFSISGSLWTATVYTAFLGLPASVMYLGDVRAQELWRFLRWLINPRLQRAHPPPPRWPRH